MKQLWLKVGGIVFIIVIIAFIVYIIWPNSVNVQNDRLMSKSENRKNEVAVPTTTAAEKLYQTALLQKNSNSDPDRKYNIVVQTCRQIISEYPESPQADKARILLSEVPKQYRQKYNVTREERQPIREKIANASEYSYIHCDEE